MTRAAVEDPEAAAERRARISRDLLQKTGIDDAMIERLVRACYLRVQADPLIVPVFAARVHDWEAHITKLCAFWSSVALMTGRHHGQPMQAHINLPVTAEHFDRLDRAVRSDRERALPATSDGAFRRAGAPDRRQSQARHRERPGENPAPAPLDRRASTGPSGWSSGTGLLRLICIA
jgi:hypothetical protein